MRTTVVVGRSRASAEKHVLRRSPLGRRDLSEIHRDLKALSLLRLPYSTLPWTRFNETSQSGRAVVIKAVLAAPKSVRMTMIHYSICHFPRVERAASALEGTQRGFEMAPQCAPKPGKLQIAARDTKAKDPALRRRKLFVPRGDGDLVVGGNGCFSGQGIHALRGDERWPESRLAQVPMVAAAKFIRPQFVKSTPPRRPRRPDETSYVGFLAHS